MRSLLQLQANASTARTLNLIGVWQRNSENPAYADRPLFKSPILNRSIILKHRLRANELELFEICRTSATKVILPLDPTELRAGARSFFVGQRGYDAVMEELSVGDSEGDRCDANLLEVIDQLPSLDPFLMRERLKQNGFAPDRCYFDLTEADSARMFAFVRQELTPLIGMSFDNLDARINDKTAKLAQKILANAADAELEPLRQGMGMGRAEFVEGVFCWKGFIYYKWTLANLLPEVRPIAAEISRIKAADQASSEERAYIEAARERLTRALGRACETVRGTLKIYDDAYIDLTRNGQPNTFREFLLKAPDLFHELGERLGSVHHILSYWRYRFPAGSRPKVTNEELCDLFADFEASLSFEDAGRIAA